MKQFFKILSVLSIAFLVSCDDNTELEGKTPGIIYLPSTGINKLTSYDVGEVFEQEIWVNKGGLSSDVSSTILSVEDRLIDSINTANGTTYKLLPADCYQLENATFDISGISTQHKISLKYDPDKILANSANAYDTETFILPLRLKSQNGYAVNPAKNTVFYTFSVSDPILQIMNEGEVTVDISAGGSIDLVTELGVPFSNKWDITANIVHKQETLEAYNSRNNSFFSFLPTSAYTGESSVTLATGENRKNVVYSLNTASIPPGNYVLPVQLGSITSSLNGTVTDNIKFDAEKSRIFVISKLGQKIAKTGWTIQSFTSQEPSGEGAGNGRAIHLIDDNNGTFWHSKWQGGDDPLPYQITIDMGREHLVSQIEIVPRNNANNGIKYLRFETSTDGTNWEYVGKFDFDRTQTMMLPVKASTCRYIKLMIPEDAASSRVAAIMELSAYGN